MKHEESKLQQSMGKVEIKPISVNEAWQGKRFKTPKYKKFESDVLFLLPKIKMPEPPYEVHYEFGFSNCASDIDNPIKPFQDILQKRYGLNDKNILKIVVEKNKVSKGNEYIYFNILHYQKQ